MTAWPAPGGPGELSARVRRWHGDDPAQVRHALHRPLLWLLDRHGRRNARAVTNAISRAMAYVSEHAASDDTDLAAVAIDQALQGVELPAWNDRAGHEWLAYPPGARLLVTLAHVEQVDPAAATRLIPADAGQITQATEAACQLMGLDLPTSVACPGWPNVAVVHRSREDDAQAAFSHLEHCEPCRDWHLHRNATRARLADLAPSIGATGLGYVLAKRIVTTGRRGDLASRLAPASRKQARHTLWH